MADRYRIVRFYMHGAIRRRVLNTGLTLEQAQDHCKNPKTSSRTNHTAQARRLTNRVGAWFDGYEEER